jgi:glutamine amidotransferase
MIAIVDYKAGNLLSVYRALLELGEQAVVTSDPAVVLKADKVIFPGVGAARQAMASLRCLGLDDALRSVAAKGTPLLGICIGAQIVLSSSEENGGVECLGLIPGHARQLALQDGQKLPHMGWNQVQQVVPHGLFQDIPDEANFYFVHSFYPDVDDTCCFGKTAYGSFVFPSIIGKGNVLAAQCHIEKSGRWGLQLLQNFLRTPYPN